MRSSKGWSLTPSVAEIYLEPQVERDPGDEPESEWMELNMGPHHPSTHGVLRVRLKLDGEICRDAQCDIGYLHTGFEKSFEDKTFTQGITFSDRMDYLAPPINNVGFVMAVEKLMELDVPPRAQAIRVAMMELARIGSHALWLGTTGLDLGVYSGFFYAWRDREKILDLNESYSGVRMMTSFTRVGGVAWDLPDGWLEELQKLIDVLPSRIDDFEALFTHNPIWIERTKGLGVLSAQEAIEEGVTGPVLRATGINYDVRKAFPYCGYEQYDFEVPVGIAGDAYERYLLRIREMRESIRILQQVINTIPSGPYQTANRKVALPPREELATSMESVIHHFRLVSEGFKAPEGEVYAFVESPRGELGYYLVSDGSNKPYRMKVRPPSFCNLQSLPRLVGGRLVADVVAVLGSLDFILGDVDR
jgi:NADH-quinone oxidoreductase subunit D